MKDRPTAAVRLMPQIDRVLDIGCGEGNNTLKLKELYGKSFDFGYMDEELVQLICFAAYPIIADHQVQSQTKF